MNPEQRMPSKEEMESITAGLEMAAKAAEQEVKGEEKLKDLTDEDVAAGLSELEETAQRDEARRIDEAKMAAEELAGVSDEEIDEVVNRLD